MINLSVGRRGKKGRIASLGKPHTQKTVGKAKYYKRKTLNEPRLAKGAKPVSVLPRASIPTKKTKEKKSVSSWYLFTLCSLLFLLLKKMKQTQS